MKEAIGWTIIVIVILWFFISFPIFIWIVLICGILGFAGWCIG